jgi:tetratricopeptide (TPR) repeat protein
MNRFVYSVAVAALLHFSVAALASAQAGANTGDAVARNLFNAGKVAFDAGDYRDALQFFEQAYARSQRPGLLYNIGQAADRLRMDARALEAFRGYLQQLPDAENRTEVENRIRALEALQQTAVSAPSTTPRAPTVTTAPTAPTATETAHASRDATNRGATHTEEPAALTPTRRSDPDPARDDSSIASAWWLWTTLGVVVVGGVIAAVALSSSDSDDARWIEGDVGDVSVTLTADDARAVGR